MSNSARMLRLLKRLQRMHNVLFIKDARDLAVRVGVSKSVSRVMQTPKDGCYQYALIGGETEFNKIYLVEVTSDHTTEPYTASAGLNAFRVDGGSHRTGQFLIGSFGRPDQVATWYKLEPR